MKNRNEQIQKEVEKTMACFDRLDKIEANPFFYTRLETRLTGPQKSTGRFRSALQSAWVIALILINLVSVIFLYPGSAEPSGTTRTEYLQEIATDLTINQSFIDPFEQNN